MDQKRSESEVNLTRVRLALRAVNSSLKTGPSDSSATNAREILIAEFRAAADPYGLALSFLTCSMNKRIQNSVPVLVMQEFKDWIEHLCLISQHTFEIKYLTHEVKQEAFRRIRKQLSEPLLRTVTLVFKLDTIRESLIGPIKDLASKGHYKEACVSAMVLGLVAHFDVDDFVVPLMVQGKIEIFASFMSNSVAMQMDLISYLESLLEKASPVEFLQRYARDKGIEGVRHNALNEPCLEKLLRRILGMENPVSPTSAKKISRLDLIGNVRTLVRKRYDAGEPIGEEGFEELLDCIIQKDSSLAPVAISFMRERGDLMGADKCAARYKIPSPRSGSAAPQTSVNPANSGDSKQAPTYYKLQVPMTNVHFIDTFELLDFFLEKLKAAPRTIVDGTDVLFVGFDAEWKAFLNEKAGVALIQVALPEDIFLLDTVRLCAEEKEGEAGLERLLTEFFWNQRILKIGYQLSQDMERLARTTPAWDNILNGFMSSVIDLYKISKKLLEKCPEFYPGRTAGNKLNGLTELMEACTGLRLRKAEQVSNWEQRPLREAQIIYAAADASCLLLLFDTMERRAQKLSIPIFELFLKQIIQRREFKEELEASPTMNPVEDQLPPIESPFQEPRGVKEIKFVCEFSMEVMAQELRSRGLDTITLHKKHLMDVDGEAVVLDDHRSWFLLRQRNTQVFPNLPKDRCYVVAWQSPEAQVQDVLNYFKLVVKKADIFSRCSFCNGNEFESVSGPHMQALALLHGGATVGRLAKVQASWEGQRRKDRPPRVDPVLPEGWELLPDSQLMVVSEGESRVVQTKAGAKLHFKSLLPVLFRNCPQRFYVCSGCGRVSKLGKRYKEYLSALDSGV